MRSVVLSPDGISVTQDGMATTEPVEQGKCCFNYNSDVSTDFNASETFCLWFIARKEMCHLQITRRVLINSSHDVHFAGPV